MNLAHIIAVARGQKTADLLITNCRIVNVFSGEIVRASLGVAAGYFVGMGDYSAQKTINLGGRFIAPGFVDAHMHIESSMLSVTEFARAVLPSGTTTVIADPHEIANVLGVEGVWYMLESAKNQPLNFYFSLPSCVPATNMETAGAKLGQEELEIFMNEKKVLAMAEMMNYPGVILGDLDVLAKINLARSYGKRVDGHAPGLSGTELNAYIAAGISSDHECTNVQEAEEKLNAGMFIMVREGTCARNLDAIFPAINKRTSQRMMWCTDDRHPHDLLDEGHVDFIVRKAVSMGLDPITAIQMGTINPVRYFGIQDLGAIAPGRKADFIVFSDLENLQVEQTWCKGVLVSQNKKMNPAVKHPPAIRVPKAMNLSPEYVDFSIPAQGTRVRVIQALPDQVVTKALIMDAAIYENQAISDPDRDLLKIGVVERYSGEGRTGKGFVKGLGLKRGALASSVAHDSHNIIVTGVDDLDMETALTAVVKMGGGMAVACGGKIMAQLALPIAGLMSDKPLKDVRQELDILINAAHKLGSFLHDPFMTLGFLALPVIPELKITDKGLVDVSQFKIVPIFAE